MPWFKVDDRLATHPKVAGVTLAAMGLWVKAGSWSAQYLTDGYIPRAALAPLGAKPTHAQALVTARLWTEVDGGWQFRDWFDFQPSAADTAAAREERADSGRRGNHIRWHVNQRRRDPNCKYCQEPS